MTNSAAVSSKASLDAIDAYIRAYEEFEKKSRDLGPEVHVLWTDAHYFFGRSLEAAKLGKTDEEERFLRATVLVAAAAFESFTNFLAHSVVNSSAQMTEFERNILLEQQERVNDKGQVHTSKSKCGTLQRFLLLFRICSTGRDFDEDTRKELQEALDVRDAIVHPKPGCNLNLAAERRGIKVFHDFLTADIMLTVVAKTNPVL